MSRDLNALGNHMNTLREYLYSLDFPTYPGYDKALIRQVQGELLKMAVQVCEILERHGFPYFITNGTLIGAALYQAFVPWDDDFDLFLFDDTYDEAMRVLEAELPSHLIVHSIHNDPLYFPAWNRVKNLRSIAIDSGLYNPDNRLLKYPCLSVDLYRLKKIPADGVDLYKTIEALKFFEKKHNFGLIDDVQYKNQLRALLQKKLELEGRAAATDIRDVYMFMVMLKTSLSPEDIFPLRRYSLEGKNFWGPQSSDAVLTSLYGPLYREIPNFAERRSRFSEVRWKKITS